MQKTNRSLTSLLLAASAVSVVLSDFHYSTWSSSAQLRSERYPNGIELQRLIREFKQSIPALQKSRQFGHVTKDPNLEAFLQNWSNSDPSIAPFLGTWHGQESDWNVYPSHTQGKVCVLFNSPNRNHGINGHFSIGTVKGKQLYVQGDSLRVFIREGNFLGIISVQDNQPNIWPYIHRSLLPEITEIYTANFHQKTQIIQKFKAANCTT